MRMISIASVRCLQMEKSFRIPSCQLCSVHFGHFQKILGFVTLGRTVTEAHKSAFELVDSLASYTYIALSNAILIEFINNQKKLLQEKLDRLIKLNRLSKI